MAQRKLLCLTSNKTLYALALRVHPSLFQSLLLTHTCLEQITHLGAQACLRGP